MKAKLQVIVGCTILSLLLLGNVAKAKDHTLAGNPNDPTYRLFNLLDTKFNGKLDDLYVLADLVSDPKTPGQQLQRVVRLEYDKDHAFGKLNLHIRSVAPLTPDQLKAYTPKQVFDFAEADTEKFTKSDVNSFGKPGDIYFQSRDNGALSSSPVTPEVQSEYDLLINQYLIPALEKKAAGGTGA